MMARYEALSQSSFETLSVASSGALSETFSEALAGVFHGALYELVLWVEEHNQRWLDDWRRSQEVTMEVLVSQEFAELLHLARAPCLEESLGSGEAVAPLVFWLCVLEETVWPFSGQW